MKLVVGVVSVVALALGCGGRVAGDLSTGQADAGPDIGTETTGNDAATVDDTEGPVVEGGVGGPCNLADGTPFCQARCGGTTCKAFAGCQPFFSASKKEADIAICSELLPSVNGGLAFCTVCPSSGMLCARYSAALTAVCVQRTLCDRLISEGFPDACWYQDKSPWSPADAIPSVACPSNGPALGLCGGACGGCSDGLVCTGRSVRHPFGVCAAPTKVSSPAQNRCGSGGAKCSTGQRCFFFDSGPLGDRNLAEELGFCLPSDRCLALAAGLPGGGSCR